MEIFVNHTLLFCKKKQQGFMCEKQNKQMLSKRQSSAYLDTKLVRLAEPFFDINWCAWILR